MFKKYLSLCLAALLVFALALPVLSLVDAQPKYATPAGYNDHDYQKLVAFLETEVTKTLGGQPLTKTNGYWLFDLNYDPEDPSTWGTNKFTWTEVGGEYRLSGIDLSEPGYYQEVGGELDVSGCTALMQLNCEDNYLTGLNVSGCTALEFVRAGSNRITWVDFSNCPALTALNVSNNELTSLDLSNCPSLDTLYCGNNQITELDVSGCEYLCSLNCSCNQLTELDLSSNAQLAFLYCGVNDIEDLYPRFNPCLITLSCSGNPRLSQLYLSANTALVELSCSSCDIHGLDLSGLSELEQVFCSDNPISSINLDGCSSLYQLYGTDIRLHSLNFSDCPYLDIPDVHTEGKGCFGIEASPFYECKDPDGDGWWYDLYAYPDEGETFIGWYGLDGELLSRDEHFGVEFSWGEECPWAAYESFTALFTDGGYVPGDMDYNGEVDIADALYVLRAAMGLLSVDPHQLLACDIDGDGELTVADALQVMRAAMGLITLG
ncbi:MAG: leucine-rich repeat domain-containing protein [Clostridia bacterium]|nr:leucine-rich repeat domain-containing protein [Clostridia bacterium]MBQ2110685.1 leucine-rich repeat domain-containing protein [Clostridia bacterium]MBQ3938913.1 leucine-rich repeat domain-containing protein [Clostridia bacterium]